MNSVQITYFLFYTFRLLFSIDRNLIINIYIYIFHFTFKNVDNHQFIPHGYRKDDLVL